MVLRFGASEFSFFPLDFIIKRLIINLIICRKGNIYFNIMYVTDALDEKIVKMLMKDGRIPAAEIARLVGDISERVVRYRIDHLVTEKVIQIRSIINPKAFGFTTIADIWLEVESDAIQEVAERVTQFENVSYVACSIGESDVSIQVLARDTSEVYKFITEVIRKIPGVRKTTTTIVPVVLKDVYEWNMPSHNSKNK
jgi:Lrp/AsnC family transcriptional regulator for asnA, asnC and gidA